jgi:hypothetical protein
MVQVHYQTTTGASNNTAVGFESALETTQVQA